MAKQLVVLRDEAATGSYPVFNTGNTPLECVRIYAPQGPEKYPRDRFLK